MTRFVIAPTPRLRGIVSNLVGALKRLHGQPTRRDMPCFPPPGITRENAAQMFGEAAAADDFDPKEAP